MSFVEWAAPVGFGLLILFLGEAVFGIVGYLVIAAITLGAIHGESSKEANLQFPWHGLAKSEEGKWVVESQVAALVGAIFFIGVMAAYIAWRAS
jgi:hypothetical protein